MPFIFKHVAAMPDVHVGIGATVGSVIPTKGAVIPAAVGVDIGCGMMAARTSLMASDLPDNLACVVAGRRRVTLFPPAQLENLYIGPLDHTPAGQAVSLVDFHAPDPARFPKFTEALRHARGAVLEPAVKYQKIAQVTIPRHSH